MLTHDTDTTIRPALLPRPRTSPVVAFVAVLVALLPALFCVGYLLGGLLQ